MTKSPRLFFAIVPDKSQQCELFDLAKNVQLVSTEKITPANMMHMTLRYIGPVSNDIKNCLISKADQLVDSSFTLHLNKTAYWKKPQVTWAGSNEVDSGLLSLVDSIESICQQCGVSAENRAYIPHVTLLKKSIMHSAIQLKEPIEWQVKQFVLVESVSSSSGVVYNIIKDWLLH